MRIGRRRHREHESGGQGVAFMSVAQDQQQDDREGEGDAADTRMKF
jgi:hypothetical protein